MNQAKKVVETMVEVEGPKALDEIAREGARQMLATMLEAEVDAFVEEHTMGDLCPQGLKKLAWTIDVCDDRRIRA